MDKCRDTIIILLNILILYVLLLLGCCDTIRSILVQFSNIIEKGEMQKLVLSLQTINNQGLVRKCTMSGQICVFIITFILANNSVDTFKVKGRLYLWCNSHPLPLYYGYHHVKATMNCFLPLSNLAQAFYLLQDLFYHFFH